MNLYNSKPQGVKAHPKSIEIVTINNYRCKNIVHQIFRVSTIKIKLAYSDNKQNSGCEGSQL